MVMLGGRSSCVVIYEVYIILVADKYMNIIV